MGTTRRLLEIVPMCHWGEQVWGRLYKNRRGLSPAFPRTATKRSSSRPKNVSGRVPQRKRLQIKTVPAKEGVRPAPPEACGSPASTQLWEPTQADIDKSIETSVTFIFFFPSKATQVKSQGIINNDSCHLRTKG